jgi:hypothetical protein
MQVDVEVLLLRQRLTIEEAAQLIAAGSGSKPKGYEDLLIEAIESRSLVPVRFERFESIDYFDGNPLGPINPMVTTVQRAALDDWCQKKGIPLPGGTVGQAGEGIPTQTGRRKGDKWTDEDHRQLLADKKLPGMTQKKLAAKYGMSRMQITRQLTAAEEKFGSRKPASVFPTTMVRGGKKEGNNK